MKTPHFEFFGTKPDYRILFPFGCIGAFCRARDGNHDRTNFESQCMLGIALGRSEYTNGMIFYNPIMDSFCTSADYLIDKNRLVGEVFPSLRYDGGLTMSQCPYYLGRMVLLQNLVLVNVFLCKTTKRTIY